MKNIDDIIIQNESLIYSIINKYKNYFELDDLYQVAVLGMIKAYNKYDNKMNVRAFTINFSSSSIGSTSIGNLGTEIGNYVKITDKKIIENFLVGNSNYRIHKKVNVGLNINSGGKIEETESDFKVSLIDNTDAIVYYFESKLNICVYCRYDPNKKYGIFSLDSLKQYYKEMIKASTMGSQKNIRR